MFAVSTCIVPKFAEIADKSVTFILSAVILFEAIAFATTLSAITPPLTSILLNSASPLALRICQPLIPVI